jgi:hypothetical protein
MSPLGVGIKQVDDTWLRNEQINNPRTPALPLALCTPPNLPQSAQTRNHIPGIRTGCQVQLKEAKFLIFKEVLSLLRKGWVLDKSQYWLTLTL